MKTFDWLVVGGGLAGSALGYELVRAGLRVLLLEPSAISPPTFNTATNCSYGGIAYWSGTTPLMQQLCQEGIELHRNLSTELDGDTEYRELNLVLTIDPDRDPQTIAETYRAMETVPTLVDAAAACELEPLLNPDAIAAALVVRHGHVSPEAIVQAYQQAFLRLGGEICREQATDFLQSEADSTRYQGVKTAVNQYLAENIVVCAGGLSRSLLREAGISVRLYATIAEIVELPPGEIQLRSLVMPAELKRFGLEAAVGSMESRWDEPGQEIASPILDAGVVQFQDGRIRIGQISRVFSDPLTPTENLGGEQAMREAIGRLIPILKDQPGQWRSCPVAFSSDRLPLVGAIPDRSGIHVFSGFGNPFAILPPLARRFAQHAAGQPDSLLLQVSPDRFQGSRVTV